jgi:rhodanese-related sulfurtransferase
MKRSTPGVLLALVMALAVVVAACSGSESTAVTQSIELVSPAKAAEVIEEQPEGLVVLDIRTPEEYAEAHLADAIVVDYYAPDFADQLDALDKNVPYVLYCRTGNRSSDAVKTMKSLGFAQVYEIDGGIVNWYEQGFPVEQ